MPRLGGSPGRRELNYPIADNYDEMVISHPPIQNIAKVILVTNPQGIWPFNRKNTGLYYSDGIGYKRLGSAQVTPEVNQRLARIEEKLDMLLKK